MCGIVGRASKSKLLKNDSWVHTPGDFYGSEMNFPVQPEELLTFIYGEDWRMPKDNWSFYGETNKANTGIIFIDEKFDYKPSDIF